VTVSQYYMFVDTIIYLPIFDYSVIKFKTGHWMELRKKIGKKIRCAREERKMTQEQFSEKAGVDVSYLSYVENGKRNVSIDVLERISNLLDLNLEDSILPSEEVQTEHSQYLFEITNLLKTMDKETLKALHKVLRDLKG